MKENFVTALYNYITINKINNAPIILIIIMPLMLHRFFSQWRTYFVNCEFIFNELYILKEPESWSERLFPNGVLAWRKLMVDEAREHVNILKLMEIILTFTNDKIPSSAR